MALHSLAFPIDQPVMPEDRQIGRRAAIDALARRINGSGHQWIIGPRRIGKTSVAKAVLARLRLQGVVALDLDLSKLEIEQSEDLAGEIARQAQAAQVGTARGVARWRTFAARHRSGARKLSDALRELGFDDEGQALAVVSSVLAGADDGTPGLDNVLQALALHARATAQPAVILLDEVHFLADLDGAERTIASWCREADCPIVFMLAGSEESAVRVLRSPGEPLERIGQEFALGDIGREDWLHGLRRRFEEVGVTIGTGEVFQIVEASEGHPRRTMLIASKVHAAADGQPDRTASGILVELAIKDARGDRAWT